jgi:hypothetical protein
VSVRVRAREPCEKAAGGGLGRVGGAHGVRPKGTSSSRAQEQFTTAAPARATSAASASEMTLVATGVRHTPP